MKKSHILLGNNFISFDESAESLNHSQSLCNVSL